MVYCRRVMNVKYNKCIHTYIHIPHSCTTGILYSCTVFKHPACLGILNSFLLSISHNINQVVRVHGCT